jgi:hypothetical protein
MFRKPTCASAAAALTMAGKCFREEEKGEGKKCMAANGGGGRSIYIW